MKKFIILFLLCLVFNNFSLQAQTKIFIHKSNNQVEEYKISDIDSITFKQSDAIYKITSIDPSSLKSGMEIAIFGTGFGIKGTNYVLFENIIVDNYISWTDTKIIVTAPENITAGNIYVVVDGIKSNGMPYTISSGSQVPHIDNISPTSARVADTLTINGNNFGYIEDGQVYFDNISAVNYVSWSSNKIVILVPFGAKTGNVFVKTLGEVISNKVSFTLIAGIAQVKTKVIGRVTDIDLNAIINAKVKLNNQIVFSDSNGLFEFNEEMVPIDRCFITAEKNGYYDACKARVPLPDDYLDIRLFMLKKTDSTIISASNGGKVNFTNGYINFQPNSLVLESGANYSGTTVISTQFIKPTADYFAGVFPGDLLANRFDGSRTLLYSYGVFPIDLKTNDGRKLELKNNVKAEISFDIYTEMESQPDSIEYWYFDHIKGIWIEDGMFKKVGNKYIAQASHFSNGNCDVPVPPAKISGKVISCQDNERLSSVVVQIGQQQITTDKFGNFSLTVPSNITKKVFLPKPKKSDTISFNLKPNDSVFVTLTSKLSPVLKGKLTDCNDSVLSRMIYATWGIKGFASTYSKNGVFNLSVEPDVEITLHVGSNKKVILKLDSCEVHNIGTWKICNDTLSSLIPMSLIPSGSFYMGSIPDASPVHKVTLTKSFYMGKTEITQGQWKAVMGTLPYTDNGQDELPIVNITLIEAMQFCNMFSEKEGLKKCYDISNWLILDTTANGYRLPSEAEWEYACRAGTNTDFYSGNLMKIDCSMPVDSNLNKVAWYCGNSVEVKPVGLKLPNKWNLYDTHGNVGEWVWDEFIDYSDNDVSNPIQTIYSDNRIFVIRGGTTVIKNSNPKICSSYYRTKLSVKLKGTSLGFRVVRPY